MVPGNGPPPVPQSATTAPPPVAQTATATAPPPSVTQSLFCRNCGKPVAPQAVACMSCGLAPSNGNIYCRTCGADTHPEAVVCVKCGSATKAAPASAITFLDRCYYPFLIALVAIFGLGPFLMVLGLVLTVSSADVGREYGAFIFLYLLGVLAGVGLAVCNVIVASDNRYGTKPLDAIILVLAALTLALPFVGLAPAGLLTQIAGCAVSIVTLLRYLKTMRAK